MELMHAVHVPAGPGPFPTIIALHGFGANAHDLFGLAPMLHGGEALVISPQAPHEIELAPGFEAYAWFPLTGGAEPDSGEVVASLKGLAHFLDAAFERYPADPERTVLLGFSQGGYMAYELALREPSRFAGLVALSSWLPDAWQVAEPAPWRGRDTMREALGELPLFIAHGTEDDRLPVERGQDARDALMRLGATPDYREYAMGHEVRPEALGDLVAWLDAKCFSD